MIVRMVVLTKSSKFGEYCVAGINYDTGKWVRLVSTDETTHGAITLEDLHLKNELEKLDPLQPEQVIMSFVLQSRSGYKAMVYFFKD